MVQILITSLAGNRDRQGSRLSPIRSADVVRPAETQVGPPVPVEGSELVDAAGDPPSAAAQPGPLGPGAEHGARDVRGGGTARTHDATRQVEDGTGVR